VLLSVNGEDSPEVQDAPSESPEEVDAGKEQLSGLVLVCHPPPRKKAARTTSFP